MDMFLEYSPIPSPATKKGRNGWTRTSNFVKRMHGENYYGFDSQITIKNRRTTPQTIERKARVIGPPCSSQLCVRRSSRHCSKFSQKDRQELFDTFWKMTWKEKRAHVQSLVDHRKPAKSSPGSRKEESFVYYLKLNGIKRQVCRNMFLGTLSLGRAQVRGWLTKPIKLERNAPVVRKGGDNEFVMKYLMDIPKLTSHYCRKSASKLYLEPIIRTQHQLYKLYKQKCTEVGVESVSVWKFNKVFDEQGIALHQLKKDRCDICCGYEVGQILESDFQSHQHRKELARKEKSTDKLSCLEGKFNMVTMDVESVLLSPVLNASALYYKTKLTVHNFTVYDLKTRHVKCYLWDETHADLVASVFANCLLDYLQDQFKDMLPIIIYSDGCTNQNRNSILSNALCHYAMASGKTIIQKYLEKGHTQMEVDSIHANIEKSFIYTPTDYISICKEARSDPFPYDVKYMKYSDFKDYSEAKTMMYPSIRPGLKTGDPTVTDLKQIRYEPNGSILYKLNHDEEWHPLPRKAKNVNTNVKFSQLYKDRLPLPKRKHQDLMDLLHVLPEEHHQFYKNLPSKMK